MSSCLSGAGRTYGFDLDIVKSPSPSSRISHSPSPSSTLSESSKSALTISTKRPRAPRKRPNQTYAEAAALLSTIYPNVFSTKNLTKLCKPTKPHDAFSETSELLPPFPSLTDAGFLLNEPVSEKPNFQIEYNDKPVNSPEIGSRSQPEIFQEPNSPNLEEDFDTQSILDEEIGEGIDSIMGNLSVNTTSEDSQDYSPQINPYLGNPMGLGFGGKFEFGLGLGFSCNMRRALRRRDDGEWWRCPTVPVLNMVTKQKAWSSPEKKKKKKKVEKVERKEAKVENKVEESKPPPSSAEGRNPRSGLSLKLNYEEVLKAWSDQGSPFSDAKDSTESHADAIARLAQIDLFPEDMAGSSGGVREASVMRYKEKRRSRLFCKKIRYQSRKMNADTRPRMQGRFVRRPSLLR